MLQDDAAVAGLGLPGPEDHGPGGAAEVSGSADRAAASLHGVSLRALVTKREAQDREEARRALSRRQENKLTRAAQTGSADAALRNHRTTHQITQVVLQVDGGSSSSRSSSRGTDKRLHSSRNTPRLTNPL